MRKKYFVYACATGAFAASAVAVSPVAAQVSTPPPDAPSAQAPATGSATVEEVIVTAQRREERLQSVPIAITAVSPAQLAAANVTTTASLQNIAPALTLSNVNGYFEPRIRGFGSSSQGASIENSVATYVDGVYISSAAGAILDLSNIQRVEVLKGPQGTLFGRNATGGLIQVVTADPKASLKGDALLDYGAYNAVRATGYVTGPIAQNLLADLSVSASHHDGYGTNLVTGHDANGLDHDITLRSKVLWTPQPSTQVRLAFDYDSNANSDPSIGVLNGYAVTDYRNAAGVPIRVHRDPWDVLQNVDTRHHVDAYGVSANVAHDFGFATLTSITAYRHTRYAVNFDADSSPGTTVTENFQQHDDQYTQELQLSSSQSKKLKWVVGGYFFHLDSDFDPLNLVFGQPVTRLQTLRDFLTTESYAVFGQASYAIMPDTNLTAGIRYTTEHRTLDGSIVATTLATGAATTVVLPHGSLDANVPTWRLSLDHTFAPGILGYVSWNRGFKSGGYSASSPTTPAYKPEYLDAYEIGAKTILFGRRLRLNGAAFYYDYKDAQVNTLQGSLGIIYNGARAEVYGLDVDAELVATEHLSFTGGFTVLHDEFTKFDGAVISSINADGTSTQHLGSATGNRLPYAPDATVSLGTNYKTYIAGGKTQFSVNELYSSGYYTQPDNVVHQSSYSQLGSTISWSPPDERYTLRIYATNLLDTAVINYGVGNGKGFVTSYEPPRTFGGSIAVRF